MTFQELRALFPAAVRNTYLNAAAASPIALPIEQVIREHYREAVEQGDVGFGGWLRRKEETRASMAKLIGARPNEVAFTPNTSTGFSLIASVFVQRGIREVLTLAHEFPSTTLPLLNAGLRLRVVQPRPDGSYPVEDLEAALGPQTGALAASAVQFSSGYRLDLKGAAALARTRKLLFAVNGAQALGQVPVDVSAGIDFLAATSHKWLMGGYGVGIFFARTEALEGIRFPIAGWISAELPMSMDNLIGASQQRSEDGRVVIAEGVRLKHDATAVEVGSHAWGPLFGLQKALELIHSVGIDAIDAHNARLQALLRPALRARGFVPNTADDPARGSGICVFPIQGAPPAVARSLAEKGVFVSARGVGLRVATHAFNDAGDVERFLSVLEQVGVRPA